MRKHSNLYYIARFIPMFIMMGIIFFFSAMEGDDSSQTSEFFLRAVVKLVKDISHLGVSSTTMATLHLIIRKIAHFTEYLALGMTIMLAIYHFFRYRVISLIIPELIAVLYAATDEYHQYFVPGRYGTYGDVIIDGFGALVGILIYYKIASVLRINKNERQSNKAAKKLKKKASRKNRNENLLL